MQFGRHSGSYGYDGDRVTIDGQRYTLEIPFSGDRTLFFCQGMTSTFNPPRGQVGQDVLSNTLIDRDPTPEQINSTFESFLNSVKQHLGWLKGAVDQWNTAIASVVSGHVATRQARADRVGTVASGLKFALKPRNDRTATFAAPVAVRTKIVPHLPAARPAARPEPALSNAIGGMLSASVSPAPRPVRVAVR